MIGLPEETIDDIQDIHRLAKELKPDYCHFTIFCPYPDTAIYRQGLEKGVIKKDHWKEFAKNPTEDFELPIWDENFSRKELQEMLVALYKDFYLRPGYILSRIFKIKTLGELKRKTRAGISVLKMKAHEVDKLDLTKALKVKNIEIFTK